LLVTDGQREFEVQPTQVTNDLDIAAQAVGMDAQQRVALAAMQRAQAQAAQAQQQQQMQQNAATATAVTATADRRQLQITYDALVREEASLRGQIAQANASRNRDPGRIVTNKGQLEARIAAMESRREQVQEQRNRLRTQLDRLP